MRHGHTGESRTRDPGRHGDERGHGGHHHRGRHGARPFDYGELRLLVMDMIAAQPRHGYELMKSIEERMSGSYSPSPGVIYPTLSWLEDMGYAEAETNNAGRKQYRVTSEGQAFLAANRAAIDALLARIGGGSGGAPEGVPASLLRSMENLKVALRLRLRRGPLDEAVADTIATAIDTAAHTVERS